MSSIDKKALALLEAHPRGKQGPDCYFGRNPKAIPLLVALRRNGGEYKQIARIMKAQGFVAEYGTIARHLKGECRCPQQ